MTGRYVSVNPRGRHYGVSQPIGVFQPAWSVSAPSHTSSAATTVGRGKSERAGGEREPQTAAPPDCNRGGSKAWASTWTEPPVGGQ